MSKTLGIIGAGHLGQQIANYAISDGHYQKVVFFDDFTLEKTVSSHEVAGKTEEVVIKYKQKVFDELLIGIGYKHLSVRKALYEKFDGVIPFGKLIHSSCWLDPTVIVNPGCVIYPCCTLDAHSVVGANSILNISCTIAHDTIIGKHCFLSPRVALAGFITILEKCIIGINATVIDNITVAESTQLGGGTVVIKNIEKAGLYVGNPARFVR